MIEDTTSNIMKYYKLKSIWIKIGFLIYSETKIFRQLNKLKREKLL